MTQFPPGKRIIVRVLAIAAVLGGFLPMMHATPAKTVPKTGQYGVASWHAPCGCECRTASHRRWVNTEMVAAHRTLPLGSKVRVVNLANGREAIVQITDRGPYCRGRIIDVSRCAAQQLGLIQSGTAHVRLEALPPDATRPANKVAVVFRSGPLLE